MLATAPPILTAAPKLDADAADPPRLGFRGDIPETLPPAPSVLNRPETDLRLTVADLGGADWRADVVGAEAYVWDGEE
jgi:hypothetical protein